ncbi:MAG: 3-hydroxyacyl-CoA dehydrogenase, partial [Hadesarchaea archaeon]
MEAMENHFKKRGEEMEIKKIAVLGAGAMGHGIAQVAAMSGFEVNLMDIKDEFLEAGMEKIKWSLDKLVQKGRISQEDADNTLKRIKKFLSVGEAVKDADFMIEAIPEKLDLKKQAFAEADKNAPKHAILASNTSALPISEIASATTRPEKVVGMHFFNPPQLMRLVEVVRGEKTSDETVRITVELAKKFGKEPVIVNKDVPGFIANRCTIMGSNLVHWMVYNGEYTIEEVDAAAIHKAGMPMGMFGLLDYTGIDIAYSVAKFMEEREPGFKVSPLLEEKVKKGELGVKTGKGFYEYPEKKWVPLDLPFEKAEKFDPFIPTYVGINVAAELLRNGVATRDDIDKALKLGFNLPMGFLELADSIGNRCGGPEAQGDFGQVWT